MKRPKNLIVLSLMTVTLFAFTAVNKKPWKIDAAHSNISFEVNHFFTPVQGRFESYDAEFVFDPADLSAASAEVAIDVTSINTQNKKRDNHLQSSDFFNAEKWPEITFKSKEFKKKGENKYSIVGDLTIRDVTKEIEVPFEVLAMQEHPMQKGSLITAMRANLQLKRTDFGVGVGDWAATVVVGDEVDISITIEATKKA